MVSVYPVWKNNDYSRRSGRRKNFACVVSCHVVVKRHAVAIIGQGQYNVFGVSGIIASISNYQFDRNAILVLKDGSKAGKVQYVSGKYSVVGTSLILMPKNEFDAKYLYFAMLAIDFG